VRTLLRKFIKTTLFR